MVYMYDCALYNVVSRSMPLSSTTVRKRNDVNGDKVTPVRKKSITNQYGEFIELTISHSRRNWISPPNSNEQRRNEGQELRQD